MPDKHYWIVSECEGKPVLIYGDRDENTARAKGLTQLSGMDFKLVQLPTNNLQRASAILRGKRLEEKHDLTEATKRQEHERGLRRHLDILNRRPF